MTARIVVVEDDPSVAELVTLYLRNAGFIVEHARTGAEARTKIGETRPALVVPDLGLPDADGVDLFREIRTHADTPVLALTARAEDVQAAINLTPMKRGAQPEEGEHHELPQTSGRSVAANPGAVRVGPGLPRRGPGPGHGAAAVQSDRRHGHQPPRERQPGHRGPSTSM